MLLRVAVALLPAALRGPLLLGVRRLLGLLLRAGDLALWAPAQRVLVGVEVLDLCLLVAVPGGTQLVLPGVRLLGAGLPGLPAGRSRWHRRHDGRRVGGARRAGGTGVRQDAGRVVRVVRTRGRAVLQHLGGVGRARHRGRCGVGGEQCGDALGRGDLRGVRVHADALGDDAQAAGEVLGAGPFVGALAQAAFYDRPERVGDRGRTARLGAEVLVQDLEGGTAAERGTAGDQLVEEDAGAVDVDRGGLRAALGGLGRDVRGRADELVGAGQARGVGEAGDAEVGQHRVHLAAVLLEQDVGGLQVAVDDAVGVAGGEGVGDLRGEQGGGHRGEGAVLAQIAVQVGAVDEVHDQSQQLTLDDQVTDPDDVRVGQAQQDGALPQEAHDDVRVTGEFLLEDLDRDGLAGLPLHGRLGARGLPLAGSPDGPRGAATERLLEEVLAAYRPHVALPAACLRSEPL